MSNTYRPIPTSSPPPSPTLPLSPSDRPLRASVQAEFSRPSPAWWKRALLVLGLVTMVYLSFKLGARGMARRPEVVYASRYSDEYKYRPAASPVITEHLKDGRIRLRGASVGGVGIRPEDLPKTEEQKRKEEEERLREAREAAKRKLGLKSRKGKGGEKRGKLGNEI